MKNLKISLTAIVAAIILAISTGVYAYTGIGDVDPENNISMPGTLSNGTGSVSGVSGEMNYQFVEISEAKYNAVKKLEAQYELIEVYVEYSKNPTDEGLTTKYNTACEKYAKNYGESGKDTKQVVTEVLNTYGIGPDILKLCRNAWIVELTDFDANKWESTSNGKITIDLSTFKGTKYYIGWIQTGSVYDAEVYKVTGTKKDDDKKDNTTNNDDKKDNTNSAVKNDTNNENTPKTITTNKSTASSLPHTGVNDVIIALIAVASVVSGIAYIRYRKIK